MGRRKQPEYTLIVWPDPDEGGLLFSFDVESIDATHAFNPRKRTVTLALHDAESGSPKLMLSFPAGLFAQLLKFSIGTALSHYYEGEGTLARPRSRAKRPGRSDPSTH